MPLSATAIGSKFYMEDSCRMAKVNVTQASCLRENRQDACFTLPWEPAVYEHKAALLGCAVTEVANSADRLVAALLAEYETYRADYLTVGVDVYNVEAEACGARILDTGAEACPEIPLPLWDLAALPASLPLPEVPAAGRFRLETILTNHDRLTDAALCGARYLLDELFARRTI